MTTLYAIQGNLQNLEDPGNRVSSTLVARGALTPIDWSTCKVDELHQQRAQAVQQQNQNLGQNPQVEPMRMN
jgi:hypothetical protein